MGEGSLLLAVPGRGESSSNELLALLVKALEDIRKTTNSFAIFLVQLHQEL